MGEWVVAVGAASHLSLPGQGTVPPTPAPPPHPLSYLTPWSDRGPDSERGDFSPQPAHTPWYEQLSPTGFLACL